MFLSTIAGLLLFLFDVIWFMANINKFEITVWPSEEAKQKFKDKLTAMGIIFILSAFMVLVPLSNM